MTLSDCGQTELHAPHCGLAIHLGEDEFVQERVWCAGRMQEV